MSVLDEPGSDPAQDEAAFAELQSETPEESVSPEQEPQPEIAESTEEPEVEEPKEGREEREVPKVPIHALHKERAENRELKQQMSAMKEMVDEIRRQAREKQEGQQREQLDEKWDADPLGYLREKIENQERHVQESEQQRNRREAEERQQNEFVQSVSAQVQTFQKEHPDYDDALTHLLDARARELRVYGYPEDQVQAAVNNEATALAQHAYQNGRNPGEVAYELAKVRGYMPKTSESDGKLDNIEKGQKASKTLSGTQGKPESASLSDISKMDDDEFDRYWKDMEKGARGAA